MSGERFAPAFAYNPEADNKEEGFVQLFDEAISAVDFRKSDVVFGAAEYILFEVAADWALRYFMRTERRSLYQTISIHAVSIPFISGGSAFMEDNHILGYEAPWQEIVMDGAKGIPGVLAAQFLVNTALLGFHAPKIVVKDVAIMAVAKVLSRVLVAMAYPQLTDDLRSYLDTLEAFFFKQHANSRLHSDTGRD